MAMAASHSPFVYLSPQSKPGALRGGHRTVTPTMRKFMQGAGTAMLAYVGAGNVAGGSAEASVTPILTDFMSIEGFTQGIVEGRLTGPAQLMAGAMLFLLAGRSRSRMVGLFAGMAIMYFYSQGVTLNDVWAIIDGFVGRLAAAGAAFQGGSAT